MILRVIHEHAHAAREVAFDDPLIIQNIQHLSFDAINLCEADIVNIVSGVLGGGIGAQIGRVNGLSPWKTPNARFVTGFG